MAVIWYMPRNVSLKIENKITIINFIVMFARNNVGSIIVFVAFFQ